MNMKKLVYLFPARSILLSLSLFFLATASFAQNCTNDTIPPSLTCQGLSFTLPIGGNRQITPAEIITSATDNCGINYASMYVSPNNFSGEITTPVTVFVNDVNGNTGTCTVSVSSYARPTTTVYMGDFSGAVGDTVSLRATVTDDLSGGDTLKNRRVIFNLGSITQYVFADDYGIATLRLPLDQAPGNYTLTASYGGGDGHLRSSSDSVLFVITNPDQDNDGVVDELDNCPKTPNATQLDTDCDSIGDVCDVCPGGDDKIDNNLDGIPDCSQLLNYNDYASGWKVGSKKIMVCHNGNTLSINKNALAAHVGHGDIVGPCTSCSAGNRLAAVEDLTGPALTIFPNPSSERFLVELHDIKGPAVLVMYDELGRRILSRQLVDDQTSVKIDLSGLAVKEGSYFVTVSSDTESVSQRIYILN